MRKYIFASLIFLFSFSIHTTVFAQSIPVDVFQSTQPIIPERYGNGALQHIVKADNLMRRGQFELAILSYDNALVIDPYFAEGYIKRAVSKFRLGRTNEAKNDLKQGLRINPYAADLHGYKGAFSRINLLAFDQEQMLTQTQEGEMGDYSAPVSDELYQELYDEVLQLKLDGDVTTALQTVNEAIELSPDRDATLYKLRGNLYILLDDFQRAIKDYNYAIILDNDFKEAYFNRGIANILANNRADGCSDMERSVELGYEQGTEKIRYFCGL